MKTPTIKTNHDGTFAKYAQVIPLEILDAIKVSAKERGISVDMEIALRIMMADLKEDRGVLNEILRTKFNIKVAFAECKQKRQDSAYLYEVEKLRLYLDLKGQLPRTMKEKFFFINVEEVTKQIEAEMRKDNESKK